MTYYKLLPYMVSLNTLSIGSRAVFWPPLLMRTHRRDDLRKSHLAFPERESETDPFFSPSQVCILLPLSDAAGGRAPTTESLSAPREIYAQRSAFDTVLPCKAAAKEGEGS